MRQLLIVGGVQKDNLQSPDEWHIHRAGVVLRLDVTQQSAETVLEYQSPPEFCADDDPSFLLKASTFHEGQLYTCSSTEILVYDFPSMQLDRRITHPCFNDVHHVNVGPDGRMYVANTGLDMTVELSPDGEILRQWCVLEDKDIWHRFSPDVDYRKVITTKPHVAHPNFTFLLGDEVWSTRAKQHDAVCLTNPGQRVHLTDACPVHDGIVTDTSIVFTRVDAHAVFVDRETMQVRKTCDLASMLPGVRRPGWCRGLSVIDEDRILVGFTRMRPTKWKSNVNWMQSQWNNLKWLSRMPARICLFNLKERRAEWNIPLQDFGLTTVFSIQPEEEALVSRVAA